MTASALPPLQIEGFTFERVLGSGGFADIHLYTQHMPRRRVAVKVMRAAVTEGSARAQFESEANLMAQLSSHPSIVTIHHAAVSESGRPYLVMEYCSKTSLADRYQQRVLSVPEMLQTVIRLCGAVETAHLAGILHRDIKPANVLTTDYGWPALTDFGISIIAGEATIGAGGVSIPWAPPEALGGPGSVDQRSDVYSLAATAYTVLAGHSPFDGAGTSADLSQFMQRIMTAPVPPIGRDDVPADLERAIALALSKRQDDRPPSAASFARTLQRIEQEMRLPVTHMDIPGGLIEELEGGAEAAIDDAESTRIAQSPAARPAPSAPAAAEPEPAAADDLDEATRVASRAEPDDRTTISSRVTEVDDRTTVSSRATEVDDRTTVSSRAAEVDDRTRVADRAAPKAPDSDPAADRTRVVSAPRKGVIVPTTAKDVPGGQKRVAYVPSADPQRRIEAYTARSEPVATPITRVPPTVPAQPSALPATEARQAVDRSSSARRSLLVVAGIIVGAIVLIGAAVVGVVLLIGGGG